MRKIFCDRCEKEITSGEQSYINIKDVDDKPTIVEKEICVYCRVQIRDFINKGVINEVDSK